MEKSGVRSLGSRMPLTFVNIQGPAFDLEARYKSKIFTGYWKELLHRVSYICDKYRWNDSILCSFPLGGSEYFTSLCLWITYFCSGVLSKLRFLLFNCGRYIFFAPDSTSYRGFSFYLELCLSKEILSKRFEAYIYILLMNYSSIIFVLMVSGVF